jgi:hypothetical protein
MIRQALFIGLVFTLTGAARGQEPREALDKAKAEYAEASDKARAALLDALAAAHKSATAAGNLDVVKSIQAEADAFEKNGKVPTSPRMKNAVATYQASMKQATAAVTKSYEQAVRDLTKAGKIADAEAVQAGLKEFRTAGGGRVRAFEVATKEDLQRHLSDTFWLLGDGTKLRADGLVENRGWAAFVTSWKAIDRRTVVLVIEKGRNDNKLAILTFSEDLTHFTGYDFNGDKYPVAKRKP